MVTDEPFVSTTADAEGLCTLHGWNWSESLHDTNIHIILFVSFGTLNIYHVLDVDVMPVNKCVNRPAITSKTNQMKM
jgi:hypothetical protein